MQDDLRAHMGREFGLECRHRFWVIRVTVASANRRQERVFRGSSGSSGGGVWKAMPIPSSASRRAANLSSTREPGRNEPTVTGDHP
jgi:hypothetical protein